MFSDLHTYVWPHLLSALLVAARELDPPVVVGQEGLRRDLEWPLEILIFRRGRGLLLALGRLEDLQRALGEDLILHGLKGVEDLEGIEVY